MARRRYLSTEISTDERVALLAELSPWAVVLYTWMIPHASDDGTIRATPMELRAKVGPLLPVTTANVESYLERMVELGLVLWDRDAARVAFPTTSFYRYQSYVKAEERRKTPEQAAENTGEERQPPETAEDGRHDSVSHEGFNSRSVPVLDSAPSGAEGLRARDDAPFGAAPQPPQGKQNGEGRTGPRRKVGQGPSVLDTGGPEGELVARWSATTGHGVKLDPAAQRRHAAALLRLAAGDVDEAMAFVHARDRAGASTVLRFLAQDYTPKWREQLEARARGPGRDPAELTVAQLHRLGEGEEAET